MDLAQNYAAVAAKEEKDIALQESHDFQVFKREVNQSEKDEEQQKIHDKYLETKENSEWQVELKKIIPIEQRREIIEEHLEKYRVFAEYNLEEQQRDKFEQREAQLLQEQAEMDFLLRQAATERENAFHSLELIKEKHQMSVSQ